jgi:hypothetical protein
MEDSDAERSFALLREVEARGLLRERRTRLSILRPPYAALGLGVLRVLRVREGACETEIVAGYDGYERLFPEPVAAR